MVWNPLVAASVLRSKRVQGAALVLVSALAPMFGLSLPEDSLGLAAGQADLLFTQIGAFWGLIGAIQAKNSARAF